MRRLARSGRLCVALLLGLGACSSEVCAAGKKLKEAEVRKIEAAAPAKPTARPKRARRLLLFSLSPGYKHSVIPYTTAAIEIMGRKSGAYRTVTSDDPAMFEPGNLARFDAVVLNNTCGKAPARELFLPANLKKLPPEKREAAVTRDKMLKQSFAEFVKSGKGLVGFHGCTGAFFTWPEFGEMLGAYFLKHPWNQKIRVKVDDPSHPLCTAFGGKSFELREETYVFKGPCSRDNLRVLLALDTTSVNASKGGRKDGDYPLAWVKSHGKGRVFYSAFSHYGQNFQDPKLLRFYLDGIQFALGDLDADTTPSAKLK